MIQEGETVLLASPTTTGRGATSTINLNELSPAAQRSASTSWSSSTSTSSTGSSTSSGGGNSTLSSTGIIAIASSIVVAVAAVVGLWYASCAKRHSSRMRNLEERRLNHEVQRDSPNASRSLVLQRPDGVALSGRSGGGQGFNMYINEFHYHDHGAGRR